MRRGKQFRWLALLVAGGALGLAGCRTQMPHAFTWPASGDQIPTHPKPPEGGYYSNWDPWAVSLEVTPVEAVNPVQTQHVIIATVKDKEGKPLPNRRVEWIISQGSVGDIVEVDESGFRASRGYKVDNHYAVSHTNNGKHVLDRGNSDPSDDIHLEGGQTWCVITSPIEGTTYVTVYAPGIYDWSKHKVFVTKTWSDLEWEFPPVSTNSIGTTHDFVTRLWTRSNNSPFATYMVTYTVLDGPPAVFEPGGNATVSVPTDASGSTKVTIKQVQPAEGANNIQVDIIRPANPQSGKPAMHIATGYTTKTWIGPKIAIDKTCTGPAIVGDNVSYTITITNPSRVAATKVVVTDTIPDGVQYVSSTPAGQASGQTVTWSLGSLAGGGRTSITVQAKATRVGEFENCAEVRADAGLQSSDCCTTVVTAPKAAKLAIEKRCPTEVLLCDPIEYVITVRNAGDGPAVNVKTSDKLPAGLTTTNGKDSVASNIGTLKPGEAKEVRYTVNATKTGQYNNKVTATADGGLSVEATCATIVKQPVLEVIKTGPSERYAGRPAEYEITTTNKGDAPARDTLLVDTLPAGTGFVRASDAGAMAAGKVTWKLGTLAPGASKKVTLELKAVQVGSAKNTATATAYCAEASAQTSMEIKGIAAILLDVKDVEDPIEVGANETYEIVVTNQGSTEDENVTIECLLPPEMDYVSSTGPTQAKVEGKTVKFPPAPSLGPKDKLTYKVVAKGLKAGDVRFTVVLRSDMLSDPPVQETESTKIY